MEARVRLERHAARLAALEAAAERDVSQREVAGQVLVVSQIEEGNSCHIAYVDALANKDANELARAAADKAGDFDCANDEPEVIGKFTAY